MLWEIINLKKSEFIDSLLQFYQRVKVSDCTFSDMKKPFHFTTCTNFVFYDIEEANTLLKGQSSHPCRNRQIPQIRFSISDKKNNQLCLKYSLFYPPCLVGTHQIFTKGWILSKDMKSLKILKYLKHTLKGKIKTIGWWLLHFLKIVIHDKNFKSF